MRHMRHEIAAEFIHTWPRHEGQITRAAHIFDMKPASLARSLYRARKDGIEVHFIDDSKAESQ